MYKYYFPVCPVDGPIEPPVQINHMGLSGAVPNKCGRCPNLFEGSCTRYMEEVGRYLHLDYGYCGIPGPTDPVTYQDQFIVSKVEIPRKCSTCVFLDVDRIRGFNCRKDAEKWGHFERGLDWGAWEPDWVYLELPPPKVTTRDLAAHAKDGDLVKFIREYRRLNPGLSMEEAKDDYRRLRDKLERPSE